jgi:hypothetical protein
MIGKIIATIHLLLAFFYSFYAFIVPKNFLYDYYYFVFLCCVQFSWLLCNHECPLSYLYKYIHYKNYKCGDTTTLDDFKELTGGKNKNKNKDNNSTDYSKIVDSIFSFFLVLSIIITGYRSNLANIYLVIFVFIIMRFFYIFLNNAVGYNTKEILIKNLGKENYKILQSMYYKYHIVKNHNEINMCIELILILFLFYITYRNRKRF